MKCSQFSTLFFGMSSDAMASKVSVFASDFYPFKVQIENLQNNTQLTEIIHNKLILFAKLVGQ